MPGEKYAILCALLSMNKAARRASSDHDRGASVSEWGVSDPRRTASDIHGGPTTPNSPPQSRAQQKSAGPFRGLSGYRHSDCAGVFPRRPERASASSPPGIKALLRARGANLAQALRSQLKTVDRVPKSCLFVLLIFTAMHRLAGGNAVARRRVFSSGTGLPGTGAGCASSWKMPALLLAPLTFRKPCPIPPAGSGN